jgi:phenylalanyl-tRNA synthetase beta chain
VEFHDVLSDVEALLRAAGAGDVYTWVPAEHPALHPGRCAAVRLGDRVVGHVGELHPRWRQAYELPHPPLLFELELDAVLAREVPVFAAISRQQPVSRDVALVVRDGVAHDALVAALRADPAGLIRGATLFDVWKPGSRDGATAGLAADERSLAIRLELLDFDHTLTDDRIDAAIQAAVAACRERLQNRQRALFHPFHEYLCLRISYLCFSIFISFMCLQPYLACIRILNGVPFFLSELYIRPMYTIID